ncbi:hypothetical protein FSARC_13180 [Fusarium sarcochroum]|uniref:Lysine-specific metallo-endopeptidase domain-containing protein n=1 Tax=Fusarium sarcochroum TaxID=1208366 RepID=A0A8H4T368_9HYPO|nr:hypothetical protein FSARC_13180 [Fusarium sarcochroum]
MLIPHFLWLLFGMFTTVNCAKELFKGWELDSSCKGYLKEIEQAYDDAMDIAEKARNELERVKKEKPDNPHYYKVMKNLAMLTGAWDVKTIDTLIARYKAVHDSSLTVTPAKGYIEKIKSEPLMQCDNGEGWMKKEPHDDDPNDTGDPKDPNKKKTMADNGYDTATWVRGRRYIKVQDGDRPNAPNICTANKGGEVDPGMDILTLCFNNAPDNWKKEVPARDFWDDISKDNSVEIFDQKPWRVILHEILHWSSLREVEEEEEEEKGKDEGPTFEPEIDDYPCLDHRGWSVFQKETDSKDKMCWKLDFDKRVEGWERTSAFLVC